MAEIGFNGDFRSGTAGAPTTLTDWSQYVKSVKFSRNGETFDVTTFGNDAKKWIKGLTDASVDIEMFYHATPYAAMQALADYKTGGVSWQYGVAGTTTGNPKASQVGSLNTGTGIGLIIEKVDIQTSVAEVLMMSISAKVSGVITFGTY